MVNAGLKIDDLVGTTVIVRQDFTCFLQQTNQPFRLKKDQIVLVCGVVREYHDTTVVTFFFDNTTFISSFWRTSEWENFCVFFDVETGEHCR